MRKFMKALTVPAMLTVGLGLGVAFTHADEGDARTKQVTWTLGTDDTLTVTTDHHAYVMKAHNCKDAREATLTVAAAERRQETLKIADETFTCKDDNARGIMYVTN